MSPEEAAGWARDYYRTLEEECEPVAAAINPNIAVLYPFFCDRDEAHARQIATENQGFFPYGLAHYWTLSDHEPGKTDLWDEYRNNPKEVNLPLGKTDCIGTPDQLRELLRGFEGTGLDQIIFMCQGGKMPHQAMCGAYELFAREVMPEFAERERKRAAEKAATVARLTEKLSNRPRRVRASTAA